MHIGIGNNYDGMPIPPTVLGGGLEGYAAAITAEEEATDRACSRRKQARGWDGPIVAPSDISHEVGRPLFRCWGSLFSRMLPRAFPPLYRGMDRWWRRRIANSAKNWNSNCMSNDQNEELKSKKAGTCLVQYEFTP